MTSRVFLGMRLRTIREVDDHLIPLPPPSTSPGSALSWLAEPAKPLFPAEPISYFSQIALRLRQELS